MSKSIAIWMSSPPEGLNPPITIQVEFPHMYCILKKHKHIRDHIMSRLTLREMLLQASVWSPYKYNS